VHAWPLAACIALCSVWAVAVQASALKWSSKCLGTPASEPVRQRTNMSTLENASPAHSASWSDWMRQPSISSVMRSSSVKGLSSEAKTGSSEQPLATRQKTPASLVAPTRLEASLLRAVTSSALLKRCAASFRAQEFTDGNYQKSFEAKEIGDFISHDWASGRVGKLLALCLIYNSQAALLISTVTSLVLAWLQYGADPILPTPMFSMPLAEETDERGGRARKYGYWCMVISPVVFVVVFLFWQDWRYVLKLGTRTCFLDKYCIDQANPERKAAGILGLAGFLRCSDRIVILWTPRYFTRLWCTYEVASWLHLQKPLTSVLFMPLAHATIVVTLAVAGWFSFILLVATAPYFPRLYFQLVGVGLLIGLSLGAHQARHSAAHLRAIQDQLKNFSVTSANCFCCSVGHVSNGEVIPCDREVVYTTIGAWFNVAPGVKALSSDGGPGAGDGDVWVSERAALDKFNYAVRTEFAAQVLQKAGPTQLSYRYVVIAGWPYFFRICDVVAAGADLDPAFLKNAVIMYCTICLVATPVWYKSAMQLACCVDVRVGVPSSRALDWFLSIMLGFTYMVVALVVWYPLELMASTMESPLPMIAVALIFVVVNLKLYYSDLRECFCKRRRQSRRTPDSSTRFAEPAGSEDQRGQKDQPEEGGEVVIERVLDHGVVIKERFLLGENGDGTISI